MIHGRKETQREEGKTRTKKKSTRSDRLCSESDPGLLGCASSSPGCFVARSDERAWGRGRLARPEFAPAVILYEASFNTHKTTSQRGETTAQPAGLPATCNQALLFLPVREGLERRLSDKLLPSTSRTRRKTRAWSRVGRPAADGLRRRFGVPCVLLHGLQCFLAKLPLQLFRVVVLAAVWLRMLLLQRSREPVSTAEMDAEKCTWGS